MRLFVFIALLCDSLLVLLLGRVGGGGKRAGALFRWLGQNGSGVLGGQPAAGPPLPDAEGLHGECGCQGASPRRTLNQLTSLGNHQQPVVGFFLINMRKSSESISEMN